MREVAPVELPVPLAVLKGSPLGYKTDPEGRVTTRLHLVELGNAQILTIPGEALPNIGYYLKRKMRGENNLLFGLTKTPSATSSPRSISGALQTLRIRFPHQPG